MHGRVNIRTVISVALRNFELDGFYVLETDSSDLAEEYNRKTGREFQAQLIIESSAPDRNHQMVSTFQVSFGTPEHRARRMIAVSACVAITSKQFHPAPSTPMASSIA